MFYTVTGPKRLQEGLSGLAALTVDGYLVEI